MTQIHLSLRTMSATTTNLAWVAATASFRAKPNG